ncbi:hypothetical protein GCM10023208_21080 [Erythrobacter westpacificensis]|uniref:Uncharacterized protein n=2 Tax=Erythrobacter westpacificensis TaxID=1055231 RepID=A0ABP9KD18_9SPHN
MLGCSVEDINDLVRRKALPVAFCCSGNRHFTKESIQEVIDNALEPMCSRAAVEAVPLMEYAANSNLSLAEAHSQLVKGKTVSVVAYDADLPFFCGVTVAKLFRQRSRPKAQRKDPMSLTRVASRLGTDLGGLKLLIGQSLLQTFDDGSGHVRICEGSLELFERSYAKATEYAPLLGCPPTTALKHLRKAGVRPVNEAEGHKARFVSRSEVQRRVGLKLPIDDKNGPLALLAQDIGDALDMEFIAATVRRVSDPALVVRGSNGKWSFKIKASPEEPKRHQLICNFRKRHEHRRLQRAYEVTERVEDIWPGATIQTDRRGGFAIIDDVYVEPDHQHSRDCFVVRCVTRAHELHRLL